MSCSRRKTTSDGRRASPLAIVVGLIVLAVLVVVVCKLAVHKSNPEQADEIVIASANAPAKAEAQPVTKPDKGTPQAGDVVYSTDLFAQSVTGGSHRVAHLEIRLEQYLKTSHSWIGRARLDSNCPGKGRSESEARIAPTYRAGISDSGEWWYWLVYRVPCTQSDCKTVWHSGTVALAPRPYAGIDVGIVQTVDIGYCEPRP